MHQPGCLLGHCLAGGMIAMSQGTRRNAGAEIDEIVLLRVPQRRVLTADKIPTLSGRPYPVVLTMRTDAKPGQYTRVTTQAAEFDIRLPNYLFTRSNLRNPRD